MISLFVAPFVAVLRATREMVAYVGPYAFLGAIGLALVAAVLYEQWVHTEVPR
ncbi:hypothetical protein [Halorubrum sp. F4]|uniref:hypothetical protein n=1 Tax=Halorubrum sp. F4 TaxID=2989715 RepID=UPI0024809C7E|nr:hypothetical protein [Halorubrum sp. F4]